ncbi:LEAF RUST 10 DISEASE-RESISTANCE LOCUS RECEPTOR-LIKE PROTEIN KINASE-like 1.2 isoform X4 [Helianthus annuus]|uniref:LEAF RUST 10 DISEASE-RESISTANCE LOCUS RECEPTOR-LIKE PROTEIN KINASE-like 1.2 isoform X4 n=1 Tax=Helianthus annuus TaxID=4232 RepID=UPI000B8F7B59|nr:LEAF RUST 10 DISEASE-RESISTANCE LOCUS RECEPTOR-LIKE PROTEIN KINASE-like 1.2 isoform X4 [Helianthus annuus]
MALHIFSQIIIIFIYSNFKVDSASLATNSTTCVPQNCGNGPTITSPFWIPQRQQPSCGSPQFNITCKDRNPIIRISNQDYVVKDIFQNNYSFVLVSKDAFNESNMCPTPLTNFSLQGTPFSYSDLSVNISFFYNCSSRFEEETYSIDCASNGNFSSFAVFHPEILEKYNYSIDSCQSLVHAPVHVDSINELFNESYTDVLRKGFVLEWKCSNCVEHDSEKNVKKKVIISLCSAVFGILLMCVVFYIWRRRQNKRRSYGSSYRSRNISSFTSSMTDPEKNGAYHGVQIFKYRELEKATNYFDSRNELGDGGFGTVYEGKLKDGRVVAVKRLYENNYKRVEQFMNEVGILAHLRHRNLVSLYGCTTHHSRELLLVYEYISNGTVADHLHGEKSSPGSLKWTTRMSIAVETASALVYLHASDVVHRDVKTNNILLDNSFTVKVADFGLSRLFPNNVTHVSTAPQGTPGYVDPEYHECYQLTNKSDVYSFGVVLVELISSKPAVDITRHRHEINLSSMALSKIQNDALHELVDPHLGYDTDNEIRKMISAVAELAFQCLQNDRDSRPSMDEVLECLVAVQNGMSSNKHNMLDGTSDDAVLLNHSQDMSPDSVAAAWSTSTLSTSSG